MARRFAQAGIHDRGVFPLQQANAPDVGAERDVRAGRAAAITSPRAFPSRTRRARRRMKWRRTGCLCRDLAAMRRSSSSSSAEILRPSNSLPPWASHQCCRSQRAGHRASPPSAAGFAWRAGTWRTAAVGARSRRCTTALVKWVVPIITTSTLSAPIPAAARPCAAPPHAGHHVGAGRRLDARHHAVTSIRARVYVGAAHVDADADHVLVLSCSLRAIRSSAVGNSPLMRGIFGLRLPRPRTRPGRKRSEAGCNHAGAR